MSDQTGALIPGQIADKLVGRRFQDFGELCAAVWIHAAAMPELAAGFNQQNLRRMRNGSAPYAPRQGQIVQSGQASRRTWELHHHASIGDEGSVYDLSFVRIVTPAQHAAQPWMFL